MIFYSKKSPGTTFAYMVVILIKIKMNKNDSVRSFAYNYKACWTKTFWRKCIPNYL